MPSSRHRLLRDPTIESTKIETYAHFILKSPKHTSLGISEQMRGSMTNSVFHSERVAGPCCCSLTVHFSVPSPVVPVPGVGQVGEGLQNTWGLEEDDDMEEDDNSGGEQEEAVTRMEEEAHEKKDSRAGSDIFVSLH